MGSKANNSIWFRDIIFCLFYFSLVYTLWLSWNLFSQVIRPCTIFQADLLESSLDDLLIHHGLWAQLQTIVWHETLQHDMSHREHVYNRKIHLLCFLCYVLFCLRSISCMLNVEFVWIVHSWMPLRFSLTCLLW